jgi:hypothetical protein
MRSLKNTKDGPGIHPAYYKQDTEFRAAWKYNDFTSNVSQTLAGMQSSQKYGFIAHCFIVQVCLQIFDHLQYPPALHDLITKEKGVC